MVDDHYLLYPNYAIKTCMAIGWEHAPWVLRTVVRYLATVPPPAKDLVGRNNYKLSEGTPAARREIGRLREVAGYGAIILPRWLQSGVRPCVRYGSEAP